MAAGVSLGSLTRRNSQLSGPPATRVQYFYGSIKPCVHYIPFWEKSEEDVYEVLDALPQQDELVKKIGGLPQPAPASAGPCCCCRGSCNCSWPARWRV